MPRRLLSISGEGRRVVFSVSGQRMWWVDEAGLAIRTAAVSGRERTPQVGTFQVFSRTEHATGLDGSKMDQFVRFTRGENGWAIGFHGIPTMADVPVRTPEQLGQPLSHGCIARGPRTRRSPGSSCRWVTPWSSSPRQGADPHPPPKELSA